MIRRGLPQRLGTQLILVAVVALIMSQAMITPLVHSIRFRSFTAVILDETLSRVAAITQVLERTPADLHETVLESSSSGPFRLRFQTPEDQPLKPGDPDLAADLIARSEGAIVAARVTAHNQVPSGRSSIHIVTDLAQGRQLVATFELPDIFGKAARISLQVALAVSLVTALLMWLILRRLTRPVEQLTKAADALGRGESVEPVPETAPQDVRDAIVAFNRMQVRIREHISERTRMLASVSHDLRTPITALRLQTEFVDDSEQRERMQRTLDEMQAVTESALAYLSNTRTSEAPKMADIAALLDSVCEDLRLLGRDVEFEYVRGFNAQCRPHQLARALRNLIDNASLYGLRARVTLDRRTDSLTLAIDDDGPGIPDDQIEAMQQPFTRMESSRNAHTGGHGLGLALARDIIETHGGTLTLANRDGGGLRQTVTLPTVAEKLPA